MRIAMQAAVSIIVVLFLTGSLACRGADLSRAEISQRAKDFCAAAPGAVSSVDRITPPARRVPGVASHHWRPLWHVEMTSGAKLEIADVSGIVVGYEAPDRAPAAKEVGAAAADDALRLAMRVLNASGQKTELDESPEMEDTGASTGASRLWTVRWRRVFQGIPYRDDNVHVAIEAATGRLHALSIDFSAPPPRAFEEMYTAQQALDVAQAALAKLHPNERIEPLPPRKVVVVHGATGRDSGSSRVAWACRFDSSAKQAYEVLVDIASGDVLSTGPAPPDGDL